jgi:hypothetical protein
MDSNNTRLYDAPHFLRVLDDWFDSILPTVTPTIDSIDVV